MKLVKKQIYTVVSLKHKKYIILNKEKIKKKTHIGLDFICNIHIYTTKF